MTEKEAEKLVLQAVRESKPFLHWGRWIKERGDYIGYRRQADLAAAVGCARSQIYKWFAMQSPPAKMAKGFDERIATALKTNQQMLFNGWRLTAVEKAPILESDSAADWLADRQKRIQRMERGLLILPDDGLARVEKVLLAEINRIALSVEKRMKVEEPEQGV